MSYMIMQRYTTAIREAYAGRPDVAERYEQAANFRAWLESLDVTPAIRAELVEPIRALEGAFGDLLRAPTTYARG